MSFSIIETELPLHGGRLLPLSVFSSTEEAVQHINRHLLSVPEGDSWSLIDPSLARLLPIEHDVARERLRRFGLQHGDPVLGEIYARYARRILCAITEAVATGWSVYPQGAGTMWFFSTDGILVGVNSNPHHAKVVTAMIPGQSDARAVLGERASTHTSRDIARAEKALGWRRGQVRSDRERREHDRRMQAWSREKRLYHLVFRPAVGFLRRGQSGQAYLAGRSRHRHGYFELKQKLPPNSELDDQWSLIRANRPDECAG